MSLRVRGILLLSSRGVSACRLDFSAGGGGDGSTATLAGDTTVNPTFVVDKRGTYGVQLLVNDGTFDSVLTTVIIAARNSNPVANNDVANALESRYKLHPLAAIVGKSAKIFLNPKN
jgi:hypothetical protein